MISNYDFSYEHISRNQKDFDHWHVDSSCEKQAKCDATTGLNSLRFRAEVSRFLCNPIQEIVFEMDWIAVRKDLM
jgi:hypothetical protein